MKKYLFLVLIVVMVAGCTKQVTVNPPAQPQSPTVNVVATLPAPVVVTQAAQTRTFHVTAKQFEFEPAVIEVNKGDTVTITAETLDVSHGLKIAEFNVNMQLTAVGEIKSVTFVADKAGEFPFFCSIPCGSGHKSMSGTLIVNG